MIEGKYRGKKIKGGDWHFGYLSRDRNDDLIISNVFKPSKNKRSWRVLSDKVIPETVGRYADIKDVNNIEIYEGDIVKYVCLFESNGTSEDLWGTEPQNSFTVQEVYTEYKMGIVEINPGGVMANGVNLVENPKEIRHRIMELNSYGGLDIPIKEFLEIDNRRDMSWSNYIKSIEKLGNVHENPKLLEG